jgi:1,6-anhydro-N-acetylmuramate kinase
LRNIFLINSIERHINKRLISSNDYGFDPQAIEAMAFGWMARQRLCKNPIVVKENKGLIGTLTKPK